MNIARVHNVSCRVPLSEDPEKKDTFIHLCYEPSMKASGIDRRETGNTCPPCKQPYEWSMMPNYCRPKEHFTLLTLYSELFSIMRHDQEQNMKSKYVFSGYVQQQRTRLLYKLHVHDGCQNQIMTPFTVRESLSKTRPFSPLPQRTRSAYSYSSLEG